MIFENTTVFDFETTGLDSEEDTIIEIAALKIKKGKQVGTFSLIVNPEREVPEFITKLTGITNDDVKDQLTLGQVLPFFLDFIGDSLLVAHNAAFDLSFLDEKVKSYVLLKGIENDFIDTRAICIEHFPYQSHKLDVMCGQLGISLEWAHRALNDVRATANLLHKLDKQFEDAIQFKNKLYYFKKYGPPKITLSHADLVSIG